MAPQDLAAEDGSGWLVDRRHTRRSGRSVRSVDTSHLTARSRQLGAGWLRGAVYFFNRADDGGLGDGVMNRFMAEAAALSMILETSGSRWAASSVDLQ